MATKKRIRRGGVGTPRPSKKRKLSDLPPGKIMIWPPLPWAWSDKVVREAAIRDKYKWAIVQIGATKGEKKEALSNITPEIIADREAQDMGCVQRVFPNLFINHRRLH